MEAFPTYGQWLMDGFGEQPSSAVIRTQMESGPPKQVQRYSRVMVSKPVSILFTATEYASFKTWVSTQISGGADWFSIDDPVDGVNKQMRMVASQGQPIYTSKAYQSAPGGPLGWQVTFKLEAWES